MNYAMHSAAEFAMTELDAGRHVLLLGSPGSGKSKFAHEYASERQTELDIIDCDAHLEVDDVLGKLTVRDGMWIWVPGALTRAAELGHKLLVNELSVLKASVAHVFHSAANYEPIPVRTDAGDRVIIPHKDFGIIATMNGEGLAGNYRLSPATVDRFTIIQWPYPSESQELGLLNEIAPSVPAGTLRDLIDLAQHSRETSAQTRIPPISTRALQSAAAMLAANVSLERVVYHKLLLPVRYNTPDQYDTMKDLVRGKLTLDMVALTALERE